MKKLLPYILLFLGIMPLWAMGNEAAGENHTYSESLNTSSESLVEDSELKKKMNKIEKSTQVNPQSPLQVTMRGRKVGVMELITVLLTQK